MKRIRWTAAFAWLGIEGARYRDIGDTPADCLKESHLEAGYDYLTIVALCNQAIGDRPAEILGKDELMKIVGESYD